MPTDWWAWERRHPMQGGVASLAVIARDMAPALLGADALDHASSSIACCTS